MGIYQSACATSIALLKNYLGCGQLLEFDCIIWTYEPAFVAADTFFCKVNRLLRVFDDLDCSLFKSQCLKYFLDSLDILLGNFGAPFHSAEVLVALYYHDILDSLVKRLKIELHRYSTHTGESKGNVLVYIMTGGMERAWRKPPAHASMRQTPTGAWRWRSRMPTGSAARKAPGGPTGRTAARGRCCSNNPAR